MGFRSQYCSFELISHDLSFSLHVLCMVDEKVYVWCTLVRKLRGRSEAVRGSPRQIRGSPRQSEANPTRPFCIVSVGMHRFLNKCVGRCAICTDSSLFSLEMHVVCWLGRKADRIHHFFADGHRAPHLGPKSASRAVGCQIWIPTRILIKPWTSTRVYRWVAPCLEPYLSRAIGMCSQLHC